MHERHGQDQEHCRKKTGKAKSRVGGATGDRDLQAEGDKDQAKGNLKNAGENVKDAFKG